MVSLSNQSRRCPASASASRDRPRQASRGRQDDLNGFAARLGDEFSLPAGRQGLSAYGGSLEQDSSSGGGSRLGSNKIAPHDVSYGIPMVYFTL